MIDYSRLYDMLTYRRPAGSKTEREFISRYIDSVDGMQKDSYGNRYLRIGENSTTLFSAHTDTVHAKGGRQKIVVDSVGGFIYKDDKQPLGADDATGIFIILHMIEAGVPGLYVFHRAEEVGGLGSGDIAKNRPEFLSGIDRAIAFDRKGSHSVVTHQLGERCASNEFSQSLAHELGGDYVPDNTGVFTDTANYTDIIPECTNLSVGYDNEHTEHELQDLSVLDRIIPILIALPWEELPTERDPSSVSMAGTYDADTIAHAGIEFWGDALDICYDDPETAADLLMRAYGIARNRRA